MKIRFISYFLGFSLLAAGLTAIADETAPDTISAEQYKVLVSDYNKGKDCIFSRTINDWTELDNRSLILYAPTKNKPYYVSLRRQSFDLKFAHSIGVYSKFDNRVCPYGGNALFIDGERYTIGAIKKLDKKTAKQLIAFNEKK